MKYRLNIEIGFVDKITEKEHKVGDVIEVDEARALELLKDTRKLVSLNKKIEEEEKSKVSDKSEIEKEEKSKTSSKSKKE